MPSHKLLFSFSLISLFPPFIFFHSFSSPSSSQFICHLEHDKLLSTAYCQMPPPIRLFLCIFYLTSSLQPQPTTKSQPSLWYSFSPAIVVHTRFLLCLIICLNLTSLHIMTAMYNILLRQIPTTDLIFRESFSTNFFFADFVLLYLHLAFLW